MAGGAHPVLASVVPLEVVLVGAGWLLLALLLVVVLRRPPRRTRRERRGEAAARGGGAPGPAHEAEYESVLVAFDSTGFPADAMATAVALAARRRRGIHVLVTVVVPNAVPIDARMPDQELAAQALIEQAKIHGGRRVTGRWVKVRSGQAGRVIVDAARELRASAIVMPLPRRRGTTLFGATLQTVLAERPCRVIIESSPAGEEGRRPAAVPAGRR